MYKILNPFLDLKALAIAGRCNTFYQEFWQYVLKQNVISVPEGCSTMNQAMDLAVVFSERNDCTRGNPVKVEVGEGEYAMVGVAVDKEAGPRTPVSCSNITIVGKGKGKTTILGGFSVNDKQNVKMEQLSATNKAGDGLFLTGSGTNVDITECCFKKCQYHGMNVCAGATVSVSNSDFMVNGRNGIVCYGVNTKVRLNDSTMHHNVGDGLWADDHAVVDLHGTGTNIHFNRYSGIFAIENTKVNIHLPSQHNTTHDNVKGNRVQDSGGSIANINADGTFTHIPAPDEFM